ncbi:hypothetical protein Bhyg_12366, partial [Pseudolycoriella hygida]
NLTFVAIHKKYKCSIDSGNDSLSHSHHEKYWNKVDLDYLLSRQPPNGQCNFEPIAMFRFSITFCQRARLV